VARSIEALVEEQVRRWHLKHEGKEAAEARPIVTVTGLHGAGGDQLARRLAKDLGFDHFDREIIHLVAESAHLSDQVVAALDWKKREALADWLAGFTSKDSITSAEYRYHLAHVVGALAEHGGAVIVGRGAHLLLREKALRVLASAPLEARVRTVMSDEGLSDRDARRRIASVDSDRRAFILAHYHEEFADPTLFDVVVNTAAVGIEVASVMIGAALEARRLRRGGRRASAAAGQRTSARRG
jgi:cytidylate kinase